MHHIGQNPQGDEEETDTEQQHEMDRFDRKTRDAIHGKGKHLAEGVFTLACKSFLTVIVDAGGLISQQRHQPPDKEVALAVFKQGFHGSPRHEPIVGMIIHRLHPHLLHQRVEGQGGGALKPGIGLTLLPHAINDFLSFAISHHHVTNHLHIILQVGINGNDGIRPSARHFKSRHEGILMAHIIGQIDTADIRVLLVQGNDKRPGAVAATIVDIKDEAVGIRQLFRHQSVYHLSELPGGLFKYRLFLIAGYHDGEFVSLHG